MLGQRALSWQAGGDTGGAVMEVRIGLIGAGWMGKAHTVAYRNVPLVFGPEPAMPKLEMVADVNPDWAEAAARQPRLCPLDRRLARRGRRPAGRCGRHHRAQRRARRDRARSARRRQAGLLREAARQHRGRDQGDGRGGRGRRRAHPGRLQLPEEPGAPLCARADPERRARRDHAVSRHLRSGPAERSRLPVHLAPRARGRGLRRARRHGLAHARLRAVPDRRHRRGLRHVRDLHPRAAGRGERHRPDLARRGRARPGARSRTTTSPSS